MTNIMLTTRTKQMTTTTKNDTKDKENEYDKILHDKINPDLG
jgi:hypothetical protein